MYRNGDDTISKEQAQYSANALGLDIEQWQSEYGWSIDETDPPEEGKTIGPSATPTPLLGPVTEATAGVSSSVDTSLESPEFPTMLDEVEVVADKITTEATPFLEKLTSINKDTEKEAILADYFYLKKDSNGDYVFDLPEQIL